MKLRKITTTLETVNEVFKYLIMIFALTMAVSIGLFIFYVYSITGTLLVEIFTDVLFILILLGLTISPKGSVSFRRTHIMTIFGLFNAYSMFNYSFFTDAYFYGVTTDLSVITQVMLIIGFVFSLFNVILLILRLVFLVQYRVCQNTGMDTLYKEEFFKTFNIASQEIGSRIPEYFLYGIAYQGFSIFVTEFSGLLYGVEPDVMYIIFGIILILGPVLFRVFGSKIREKNKKYVGTAAFFGFYALGSLIFAATLFGVYGPTYIEIDCYYTLGISLIGCAISLYLYFVNRKTNTLNV